jgi:Ca2+/Na+ antiporter
VTFWISTLLWLGAGRTGDEELSDILASDRLGGVAALVGIVASIAAIVAIRQISRRHDERR